MQRIDSGSKGVPVGPREKGSMRKPSMSDRISLEFKMRLYRRLAPASQTASLGDLNPGKEAQPPQTQARSQAGNLSRGGCAPSTAPLPRSLRSRMGTSVLKSVTWFSPGVKGAERPAGGRISLCGRVQ
ncbi:hypothetical protein NN561_002105 [Cricetulus griseus]